MNSLHDSYHRPLFPRGPGLGLKTLFLMLLALTLMFYDTRGDTLKPARAWTAYLLTPVNWLAAVPVRLLDVARGIDTRGGIERENRTLKEKQLALEAQLSKMQALDAENRRLRELLASSAQLPEQVLIAEIVSVSQDPYRHQITLSRGSRDGVYRGQALVDAHGVMGQVVDVAPNTSKALLVSDPNHGIPVELNRTGLQTIAVGLGDERGLRLPFLPSNADIKTGDLLVSSSLGGRFPAGYPVGTVYEVKPVAGEHFMEAYAFPAAKLNQGRQALLVWNRSQQLDTEHIAPAEPGAETPADAHTAPGPSAPAATSTPQADPTPASAAAAAPAATRPAPATSTPVPPPGATPPATPAPAAAPTPAVTTPGAQAYTPRPATAPVNPAAAPVRNPPQSAAPPHAAAESPR